MTANRFRFRAWDKDSESMIPDRSSGIHGYSTDETGAIYGVEHHTLSFSSAGIAENIILMQSTGLTDKNGKEIFEGDVVRWYDCRDIEEYWHKEVEGCEATWWNEFEYRDVVEIRIPHFWLKNERHGYEGEMLIDADQPGLEIIGNIYENPELLEKK